jgi:hypothetical protein
MKVMSNRFLLFGERPFEDHVHDKFRLITSAIERISDVEAVMYKDSFEEWVQQTVSSYRFPKLDISFENKIVDLIDRVVNSRPRYFAEYSLIVEGDTYFLGLSPGDLSFIPMRLPVEVKGNVLSFEIDTRHPDEELSEEATALVRSEYQRIKAFITDALENLNRTIEFHNGELEKFVIPQLARKLRKADRCLKIKETLNFK